MTQKEITKQEFSEKLNHSNFSFLENENNLLLNYGQKYKTCGKLRINKKLSPNSLCNDNFRLLCSEHHFKFTQKKIHRIMLRFKIKMNFSISIIIL